MYKWKKKDAAEDATTNTCVARMDRSLVGPSAVGEKKESEVSRKRTNLGRHYVKFALLSTRGPPPWPDNGDDDLQLS